MALLAKSVVGSATAAAPAPTDVLANSLRLSFFFIRSPSFADAPCVPDLPAGVVIPGSAPLILRADATTQAISRVNSAAGIMSRSRGRGARPAIATLRTGAVEMARKRQTAPPRRRTASTRKRGAVSSSRRKSSRRGPDLQRRAYQVFAEQAVPLWNDLTYQCEQFAAGFNQALGSDELHVEAAGTILRVAYPRADAVLSVALDKAERYVQATLDDGCADPRKLRRRPTGCRADRQRQRSPVRARGRNRLERTAGRRATDETDPRNLRRRTVVSSGAANGAATMRATTLNKRDPSTRQHRIRLRHS